MGQQSRGEDALHAFFKSSFAHTKGLTGPGDDCAQLQPRQEEILHWTCDQLVEGVHVSAGTDPEIQARKLLRRTLSDLAAAGATPWAVTWTIALPPDRGSSWIQRLAAAFVAEAEVFEVAVIGGDLSTSGPTAVTSPGLGGVLTCTALGRSSLPAPGRAGAMPGDSLAVTGKLGGAVQSGRHLLPEPRLAQGRRLVSHYQASAMMDLSDGMARDLPRLLAASGVAAEVDLEKLPLHELGGGSSQSHWLAALGDGEDYELLVCLPQDMDSAAQDSIFDGVGLTQIGRILPGNGVKWLDQGKNTDLKVDGWEHAWSAGADA
jgi:thiamine-monophosphate kinase